MDVNSSSFELLSKSSSAIDDEDKKEASIAARADRLKNFIA